MVFGHLNSMPGICAPTCQISVATNGAEFIQNIYNVLNRALEACQSEKNRPIIVGLSGGSMVHALLDVLPSLSEDYLQRIRFVFCEERRVPFDNPESTYGQYAKAVLPRLQPTVSKDQFVCVNPFLKSSDCAKDYEMKLRFLIDGVGQWPEMDVVLLDVGQDGHTCALFPQHPTLQEDRSWVIAVENAPKPVSDRITLTLPVLNRAKHVIFIATGSSKANIIKKIFQSNDENKISNQTIPAAMVHPARIHWILDSAAASLLTAFGNDTRDF